MPASARAVALATSLLVPAFAANAEQNLGTRSRGALQPWLADRARRSGRGQHGQSTAIGRSFFVRLLLPFGTAAAGAFLGGRGISVAVGAVDGFAAGMVAAAAIDWFSAREDTPPVAAPTSAVLLPAYGGLTVRF